MRDSARGPCEVYQDRALLALYGEGDPPEEGHDKTCLRCRGLEGEWRRVLETVRGERRSVPPVRKVPDSLLQEIPSRSSRVKSAAGVAALLLLFALAMMDGTRPRPAYALADTEIFWSLRTLNREADRIRRSGPAHGSETPLTEIGWQIQAVDRRISEIQKRMEEW